MFYSILESIIDTWNLEQKNFHSLLRKDHQEIVRLCDLQTELRDDAACWIAEASTKGFQKMQMSMY